MSIPAVLPSPSRGVRAVSRSPLTWLRRFIIRHVTPEPSDNPARLAVGATLLPLLFSAFNYAIGNTSPEIFLVLTRIPWVPIFPLLLMAQMIGLLSRSSAARFIGGVTIAFLAGGMALTSLSVFPSFYFNFAPLLLRGLLACATGVWLVRAVRRMLAGDSE